MMASVRSVERAYFLLCGRKIEQHMEESRIWNFMV